MRPGAGLALTITVASSLVALSARAEGDLSKGPYLQHLTSASVDIKVELPKALPVSVTVSSLEGDARAPAISKSAPAATFHSVHIDGLAASTRYRYSVHAGLGKPHDGVFTTAPEGSSRAPFTFIVYGDNRSDGAAHARIVEAIRKESFAFLVNTGDYVIEGADEGAWQSFFDIEEPLLADHCLFGCIGNHELHNDKAALHFERYLGATEPTSSEPSPPFYGTFRWGRARFFLLNAFEDWGSGPERSWLEGALSRADHEEGIDLRFAVIHHSPRSAGPHGDNKALLAAHIDDLLVAHHVDLVLAGHDHIYERGDTKGLKYLVSGGGGAPLYREITPEPSTRKVEATYHYVKATVADDKVSIVAVRADGSIVEECAFARGGPWLCDPAPPPPTPAEAKPLDEPPPPRSSCALSTPRPSPSPYALALGVGLVGIAVHRRRRRR
jgi:MYXO-CTERM domain-containing protein